MTRLFFTLTLGPILALSQFSKAHWGMTKAEVLKAEQAAPVRRTSSSLVYRDKKFGEPVEVIFEFTDGKLDALAYVADPQPKNPELVFLNWCLALTKRYGQGVVYLNKKPVGAQAWF